MADWGAEFLYVFAYSRKTQAALALAVISFLGTLLLGHFMVSGVEFHGPLAPLTGAIQDKLLHRYDGVAWFGLVSFLALAVKLYLKDRKRLLSIW
jgi:hypothetical protein